MKAERYKLQKLLGQGLMSVVWLASDTVTQKSVALKLLTAIAEDDRRNQKARERFMREIEISRSLQHPHILPILDHGNMQYKNRNVPYFVTPYMQEGSLADLCKANPPWQAWDLAQTADVIMQAAESLWYLHTRTPQIVHQDVKPGNFLFQSVNKAQRVIHLYLGDFGIARWMSSPVSVAGELLGTFAFIAPERIKQKVDCASDQYALAVMACLLLTGQLPIQATSSEKYVQAHLYNPPLPPSVLDPRREFTPKIDEVILRALEKEPEKRFPTIIEFAKALQQATTKSVEEQTESMEQAEAPTEKLPEDFDTAVYVEEQEATQPLEEIQGIEDLVITLDPLENTEEPILDEPLPTKPPRVLTVAPRSSEIIFPELPLKRVVEYELPVRPRLLQWSPDGRALACLLYGEAPRILGRNGVVQVVGCAHASRAADMCWSADGNILAVSGQGEIRFWDALEQCELPLVLRLDVRTIDGIDWSAHGQLAVWVEGWLMLYPLPPAALKVPQPPSPRTIAIETMHSGNMGVLRWSPDGALLLAGASNGKVMCWDTRKRISSWQVSPAGKKVNSVAWSPDSSWFAVAFRDYRVAGWAVENKERILLWERLPAMPRMLSVSTEQDITLASIEQRLLSGSLHDTYPSASFSGQLLAAWSPTQAELATLDASCETSLGIWGS
ncbi:hypothetical protein EPA93_43740 [Ktedonosporobacter rubrisoli]|uniref:non-specific serine/threonine protein kinase n=1 Tax=Ktedonosporobacter rubrisoli TaxID=2509675 RepID=A0A4P6K3Y7_KTERU|nr:serine/threonine-protein kinase [Ktedonosporobacter rubrisoli]QBD82520.1 hypothetical protein EPA93_43740 [Ktedonosporobacter rubrisoli]